MLFRKTERYYRELKKTSLKSRYNNDKHTEMIKRTTIWFLFIPLFYWETVVAKNI